MFAQLLPLVLLVTSGLVSAAPLEKRSHLVPRANAKIMTTIMMPNMVLQHNLYIIQL